MDPIWKWWTSWILARLNLFLSDGEGAYGGTSEGYDDEGIA